ATAGLRASRWPENTRPLRCHRASTGKECGSGSCSAPEFFNAVDVTQAFLGQPPAHVIDIKPQLALGRAQGFVVFQISPLAAGLDHLRPLDAAHNHYPVV